MHQERPDDQAPVVVVIGASSGMGKATAVAAAAAGYRMVLAGRNTEALDRVRTEITDQDEVAVSVPTDASDEAAVVHLIDGAVNTYGRIDTIVNAVGINIPDRALSKLTAERWDEVLTTNLTTAFHITAAAVPIFRRQGGGLLIHIASSAAKKPDKSGVAYQASKSGLVGLAHGTMEEERASGLRVTVIFPGMTDTPLVLQRPTPPTSEELARALQPEDVAAACLFVMGLPARAHVPELVLYPSQL